MLPATGIISVFNFFKFFIIDNSFSNSILEMRCQPNAQIFRNWHFVSFKYSSLSRCIRPPWCVTMKNQVQGKKKKSHGIKRRFYNTWLAILMWCIRSIKSMRNNVQFQHQYFFFDKFFFFFFSIFSCGWVIEDCR